MPKIGTYNIKQRNIYTYKHHTLKDTRKEGENVNIWAELGGVRGRVFKYFVGDGRGKGSRKRKKGQGSREGRGGSWVIDYFWWC